MAEHKAHDESKKIAKPANQAPKTRGGWIFLAIMIGLAAAAASGYGIYRLEMQLAPRIGSVAGESAAVQSQIDAIDASGEEFSSRIEELKLQIEQNRNASGTLESQLQGLAASVSKSQHERDRSIERWRTEEIFQLLAIGNQRLQFAGDFETAVATRRIADEQLGRLQDPKYVAVRKALNEEIARLEQSDQASIAAIALRLLGLAEAVDDLPLRVQQVIASEISMDASFVSEADSPDESSVVVRIWNELIEDLSSLIRVRNTEDGVTPAFSREQQYYAVENLRLLLHSAHLAALQGRTQIYRANLAAADSWLRRYYADDEPGVSTFIDALTELSSMAVEPEIPDVSESLNLLRGIQPDR